jgi:hypothetical protein
VGKDTKKKGKKQADTGKTNNNLCRSNFIIYLCKQNINPLKK